MKAISLKVKHGNEELSVWFPGLELQAYTTMIKLIEDLPFYTKEATANTNWLLEVDKRILNQESFVESLESVSDKQVLEDGVVVYTIRNISYLSEVDFSKIIGSTVSWPVYFVNEDKDLIAIWFDGRFIDDENSVEFRRFLSGFARTRFSA